MTITYASTIYSLLYFNQWYIINLLLKLFKLGEYYLYLSIAPLIISSTIYFRILGEDHLVAFGEPVLFWLRELSLVHEAECTIMLQSKPVDPGNFAKRATSITSDVSYSELGHLYNNKSEHMDTGRRCKENKILKV